MKSALEKPCSLTSLAFYLPQFHRIPENDKWWGPGFTEWTHLRNAKRQSREHLIRRPIDPLGEYCLTDPRTVERQWEMASTHGIDGFAVWDYWFGGGKQLLESPIEMVLNQQLNFRYCLAWANHSWYDKRNGRLLCQQKYLGADDYEQYFRRAARHFASKNYLKIAEKPIFILFDPHFDGRDAFFDQWQLLARKYGFPGIFFVADGVQKNDPVVEHLSRRADSFRLYWRRNKSFASYFKEVIMKRLHVELGPRYVDFPRFVSDSIPLEKAPKFAPTIYSGWDTTPRHGKRGMIFEGFNLEEFQKQLHRAGAYFSNSEESEHLLLIKSWNEWAEGNVMEPDSVFGWKLLEAFRDFAEAFRRGRTKDE